MAKDSRRRCPDCDGEKMDGGFFSAFTPQGDGKCKHCHGTGQGNIEGDVMVEILTFGTEKPETPCKYCYGTGQCQTCGGTGFEYYNEPSDFDSKSETSNNFEPRSSSSSNYSKSYDSSSYDYDSYPGYSGVKSNVEKPDRQIDTKSLFYRILYMILFAFFALIPGVILGLILGLIYIIFWDSPISAMDKIIEGTAIIAFVLAGALGFYMGKFVK